MKSWGVFFLKIKVNAVSRDFRGVPVPEEHNAGLMKSRRSVMKTTFNPNEKVALA
jgi:hypothetical protein